MTNKPPRKEKIHMQGPRRVLCALEAPSNVTTDQGEVTCKQCLAKMGKKS